MTDFGIDPARLAALVTRERETFAARRQNSRALARTTAAHWHGGVPLHWMSDWGLPFQLFVDHAHGATLTDVDGVTHADFCLGDTGAMFGHAPEPVVRAVSEAVAHGFTAMLPSRHAAEVGALLATRFGLPFWQTTLTASDANRAVIRWARAITGRPDILIFNGAYHGAVDDVHVRLDAEGHAIPRPGLMGQAYDMRAHTRVIEFNDLTALEAALASRTVALVLAEPVMTNIGMVQPEAGYHARLRQHTRAAGTLLAIDETHTISTGLGGYTRVHGLEPDFFVLGKPVAGGIPAAVYGFTHQVSRAIDAARAASPGYSGIGTTLSGNLVALAAIRACLADVMTPDAYAHMEALAAELEAGLLEVITRHRLPWCVTRVGARVEFMLSPDRPRTGGEAARIGDPVIEGALRLYLANRGVLITPFHNMMLVSPVTTRANIAALVSALDAGLGELV